MKSLRRLVTTHNNHGAATILVIVFCLAQLSGCGIVSRKFSSYDGPPDIDIDPGKIRDAVPKVEPLHPYGTRDYVVGGRRYRVLKSSKGYAKRGYASWYGSKFHGNETSTQERYNLYGMTAASPELPLPSYVQVTNLNNGKKAIVRVNDRGPFHPDRILDLSYAAAKKLGFANRGVAPVKVVAIDPRTWRKNSLPSDTIHVARDRTPSKQVTACKTGVFLQVGAFTQLDNARELSDRVRKVIENQVNINHQSNLYRVQIGPLANSEQGNKLKLLLQKKGFNNVNVVKLNPGN